MDLGTLFVMSSEATLVLIYFFALVNEGKVLSRPTEIKLHYRSYF